MSILLQGVGQVMSEVQDSTGETVMADAVVSRVPPRLGQEVSLSGVLAGTEGGSPILGISSRQYSGRGILREQGACTSQTGDQHA